MMTSIDQRVMEKLGLNKDMLNSMYVAGQVGGHVGANVAAAIRDRFGLGPLEPLGYALARIGILSDEEAKYLDDTD